MANNRSNRQRNRQQRNRQQRNRNNQQSQRNKQQRNRNRRNGNGGSFLLDLGVPASLFAATQFMKNRSKKYNRSSRKLNKARRTRRIR